MLPMTTHTPQRPAARQWKVQLPSTPRSVRRVRDQAGRTLHDWGYGQEAIDRLLLVCSELATNAVRHGHERGHLFEVRLHDEGASCLVQVSDAANRRLPHRVKAGEDDEHGRGLELVVAMSEEVGHHPRDPIGKTVWARLALNASDQDPNV